MANKMNDDVAGDRVESLNNAGRVELEVITLQGGSNPAFGRYLLAIMFSILNMCVFEIILVIKP